MSVRTHTMCVLYKNRDGKKWKLFTMMPRAISVMKFSVVSCHCVYQSYNRILHLKRYSNEYFKYFVRIEFPRSLKIEPRNTHIIIAFQIYSCVFIYLSIYINIFKQSAFFSLVIIFGLSPNNNKRLWMLFIQSNALSSAVTRYICNFIVDGLMSRSLNTT